MTWTTKLWLGPGRTKKCASCGGAVSVAWTSMIAVVVIVPGVLAFNQLPLAAGLAVFLVATTAATVFHLWFVPLESR